MKENLILKENIKEGLGFVLPVLGLAALSFTAFPKWIRFLVREEQDGCCADCGMKCEKLEVHHIVPESKGGSQTRDNAIGLCHSCHQDWDRQAGVSPQGKKR